MTTKKILYQKSQKGCVLVLDDDADTCELLSLVLKEAGYEIVIGNTITDGLRMAKSRSFDVILLDWYFIDGTGLELCQKIRSFDTHTPIFFYTGMAHDLYVRYALWAGAQGCLIKPVRIDILLNTLSSCVSAAASNLRSASA